MRIGLLLVLLILFSSCDSVVQLTAQRPSYTPSSPQFRKVGLYIQSNRIPNRLHASVDGEPLQAGGITILLEDAVYGSIENALDAVAQEVILLDTMPTLASMKRLDLDAAFWVQHFAARSQLQREGTLVPSYTTYSNITLQLKRMSGFRGTVDSLDLNGFGSFSLYITRSGRSGIAKIGVELALRDLANRIARRLSSGKF